MKWPLVIAGGALLVGCEPDLGAPESLVVGTRILAIQGEPPEVRPGDAVSFRALVAESSTPADSAVSWAFCTAPKPLTENNTVSRACLGDTVIPIPGAAAVIQGTMPANGCALFGPDTPPGNFRPRDADGTGGFYQPVRAEVGTLVAFSLERILCNLPEAPIDAAIALASEYQPNKNPVLRPLSASVDGVATPLDRVPTGRALRLEVGWGEQDAENYWMYDPETATVVRRRESLRVSWYVSAGSLTDGSTGRSEADLTTTTSTTWIPPVTSQVVHVWVVLRDSRGGSDLAAYDLTVVP